MIFKNVLLKLREKKLKIAFAESITGGRLASEFVKNKGASKAFELGVVTYSNKMKTEILNIKEETILKYGVVSQEISYLMAKNIKEIASADIGVGITGNAGPTALDKSDVGDVFLTIIYLDEIYNYNFKYKEMDRNNIINVLLKEVDKRLLNLLEK